MLRKTYLISAICLVFMMFGAVVALANAPVVTIDPVGTSQTLSISSFPQTLQVTGTICHTKLPKNPKKSAKLLEKPSNLSAVKNLTLYVNKIQEGACNQTPFLEMEKAPVGAFSMPWVITGVGTYTLTVCVWHGNKMGYAEITIVVK